MRTGSATSRTTATTSPRLGRDVWAALPSAAGRLRASDDSVLIGLLSQLKLRERWKIPVTLCGTPDDQMPLVFENPGYR
jgi:hypothetical protein